ncbi:MAG: hypothetical protein ACRD97_01400, partial [Nitrososphaeraceae archaeon]
SGRITGTLVFKRCCFIWTGSEVICLGVILFSIPYTLFCCMKVGDKSSRRKQNSESAYHPHHSY